VSKIDPITAIWSTHQSLIGHNFEKKKVKCLKCRKTFVGSINNRICSGCKRGT
jgi:hypothetical protein